MFFSFDKEPLPVQQLSKDLKVEPDTSAGLVHSLNELDSNVKVTLTNSDNDSEGSPGGLKVSIVDVDFNRLLANVRT